MKSTGKLVLLLIILGVMMPGYAQNLVQNPSFESPVSWDDLWILSTTTPSSPSAVVTEVTTDAHEGTTSVELTNTDDKKWTYFYSDSVNAPISLMANQKYEVKGWVKSVEKGKKTQLSIVWNNKLSEYIFYKLNPDPVTTPDWFMVKDTITATADFNDAFLSLGFQTDKDGALPAGRLLLDDFSVIRIPSKLTDIVDFSIPEQTGPAVIDKLFHTVTVEVPFGTDVTALIPTSDLSYGASIIPASGVPADFTSPVLYAVISEDGSTLQDWTVTVTFAPPSTENDILSFGLAEQTGPPTINNVLHNVISEVAYGTDVTALIPTISVSPGATISPASGVAIDFSGPVIYTVKAEDGITVQNYIVAVMVSTISNETDIISFSMPEEAGPANIDMLTHTVAIDVIYATDVTALVPTMGLSAGATINPAGGIATDYSAPVPYTVTAEDGTTIQDWTVSVTVLPNSETNVLDLTLAEQTGPATIDSLAHTVSIAVPYATDVTGLVPSIGLSTGASINPVSGVSTDFSNPVVYTVIAEDGTTTQDWNVTVTVPPNTETEVVDFTLAEQSGPAVIDPALHTVYVEVPYATNETALVPTISLSAGASINPGSGVSEDFSNPVVYTVTAEDGTTTQDWSISVVVLPNAETDIVSVNLAEQTGPASLDNLLHTVLIDVPQSTDLTALVPDIVLSAGASVNPASGVPADFSSPVIYSVTAADGTTTQDWTVTVITPLNTGTDIVDFTLLQQTGPATIDNLLHTVSIDVPYATDLTALVPTIGLSAGATINPVSGASADFSSTAVYVVTAEDGTTTQNWSISVVVLPNTETDVVDFTLVQQTGPAIIDNLLHTVTIDVPSATDVTALVPTILLSTGATANPASGLSADFSSTVVYTVTAEDGTTTQDWTVTVVSLLSSETDILSFTLAEQTGPATIDNLLHTVYIEVVKETNVTALVPTIDISAGATINPISGGTADFSSSVVFTVTAEDGATSQDWSVSVTEDPATSVKAVNSLAPVSVYPNPAREVLFVDLPVNGDIYLQDIMGRVVTTIYNASDMTTIPVSYLDRGTYFLRVVGDGSKSVSKIILE